MEAWLLIYIFTARPNIEMQNEDACVTAAKVISQAFNGTMACVNSFDGRVLWFRAGKQVAQI